MYTILKLREALEHSWSNETTYCEGAYSRRNPSRGQCLVSSLVLQHYLGGQIIGATFTEPSGEKGSHYWLRINGIDVDFTWQQFAHGTKLQNIRKSSRKTNLAHKNVNHRYNILLPKVENYLKGKRMPSPHSIGGVVPDYIKKQANGVKRNKKEPV